MTPEKLERADAWFRRWDRPGVLIGAMTPLVRSFVAIPAGIFEMPFVPFVALVAVGSTVWSFAFTGVGYGLGASYQSFEHYLRYIEAAVVAGTRRRVGVLGVPGGRPQLELPRVQTIPLVDVRAEYEPLIPRLEAAFREVLDGKGFIRGPHYWAFQEEAAAYLGVTRAVGVANGTDALVLALDALGVGPGDEVICPAFTFYATAESVARRGATPVFADIDPVTLNLDIEDAAAKVTDRTRAIIPVHLFGRLMDVRPLAALGVPVLEDAAQAFGAPGVAQHGAISTFSFYPTKNLFCLGDGGLVVTSDEDLADRVQLLSFHGSRDKSEFDLVGYNSRLDELQAAFLRIFLPELDGWNEGRRAAAARYAELGLGELVEIPQDEPGHVYHLFVCRSRERDAIRTALAEAGIASATYYTTPLHLQPSLRYLGYSDGDLPATEHAGAENFSLPLWPGIPVEAQERVVETSCARPSRPESDAPVSFRRTGCGRCSSTPRSSPSRGGPRSSCASTTACRVTPAISTCSSGRSSSSSPSTSPSSSPSASTTAGGVTSRCATCGRRCVASSSRASSPTSTVYLVVAGPWLPPPPLDRRDGSPAHACVRRGRRVSLRAP